MYSNFSIFLEHQEVDLSNNRLTRIPKELLDWPLLEIANFQSNNISSFKMHISVSLLIEGNPVRFASLNFDASRAFERWQEIKRGSAPLSLEILVMRDIPLEEYLLPRLVSLEFFGVSDWLLHLFQIWYHSAQLCND